MRAHVSKNASLARRAVVIPLLLVLVYPAPALESVQLSARRCIRIDGPGFRTPSWPAPALADWNGDGIPDLTLAHYAGPIWIYPRERDGSFQDAITLLVNGREKITGDSGLCVTDWNGDGLPDLLLGEDKQVSLYLNTGTRQTPRFDDGSVSGFELLKQGAKLEAGGAVLTLGTAISGLDVADWDSDGLPDLLVGEKTGKVWWFRNTGHLSRPVLGQPILLEAGGQSVLGDRNFACPAVGDWDGDGRNDLLVASYAQGVRCYLNRAESGQPVLELPSVDTPPMLSLSRARIHLADWNGDGRLDLLAGGSAGELYSVINRSQPADPLEKRAAQIKADAPQRIAGRDFSCRRFLTVSFADLDGDGVEDLIAGSHNRQFHFYLRSSPTATRFDRPAIPAANTTAQAREMGLSGFDKLLRNLQPYPYDWNDDGVQDLVFGSECGAVILLQNFGTRCRFDFDMRRQSGFNATLLYRDPQGRATPVVADLDRDGVPDLLLGNGGGELLFLRNIGSTHWPHFAPARPLTSGGAAIQVPGAATPFLTDWIGDGRPDLLVGTGEGRIRIFAAQPSVGEFEDLGFLTVDGVPLQIRKNARPWVLDWNGDSIPDLVVIGANDELVCYFGTYP